jgi:hypothetical protein
MKFKFISEKKTTIDITFLGKGLKNQNFNDYLMKMSAKQIAKSNYNDFKKNKFRGFIDEENLYWKQLKELNYKKIKEDYMKK